MVGQDENEEKKPDDLTSAEGLIPEPPAAPPQDAIEEPAFPETEPEKPAVEAEAGPPTTKPCVFCGSEIRASAMRCPHCSGFLPIAEGTAFKQYFFFLFACLAMAIGCLLPWERTSAVWNLRGIDSIGGAFLFIFAAYGVIASVWNIYHRKMIVWPVIIAALEGVLFGWSRVFQILPKVQYSIPPGASKVVEAKLKFQAHYSALGPGLYLVVLFSTIVILSIVISVFKGAKQDARRKAELRESRAALRSTRRGS
ncbi:MAG: hypothetical protein MUE73_11185 [Planctomycetes bacterium]|jgi:hypothetical protein|nr:hypothetical protein [Planctomycetota bacterium]